MSTEENTENTADADESLEQMVRRIAESERGKIAENEFQAKFFWFDSQERMQVMMMPQMDRPDNRDEIHWAVCVLSAVLPDVKRIAFVTDTYQVKGTKEGANRHDGTPWGPGGMQQSFEAKDVDSDLVTEAFAYQIIDRDEGLTIASLFYERQADGSIEFGEFMSMADRKEGNFQGLIPDMMRAGMEVPKLVDEMEKFGATGEAFGLTQAERDAHMLAVGVKMVMGRYHYPCMIPCHDEETRDLMKRSFEEGPFSQGIKLFTETDIEEIVQLDDLFEAPAAER